MVQAAQDEGTTVQTAITGHLLEMLARTAVEDEPFTHCYLQQVFPESLYQQLLSCLPQDASYTAGRQQGEAGYATRHVLKLDEEHLAVLDQPQQVLWRAVSGALCSREFQTALFDKLAVGLMRRFGVRREQVASLVAVPRPALYRDLPGYEITPHPDTRKKVVTMQLFLPQDDGREQLGTCLYRRRLQPRKGLLSWQGRFERFKQFPFRRNSGYAFVVSNSPLRPKSWHGCEKTPAQAGVRDTLLNIYYAEEAQQRAA